jgi:hypothetical protein
MDPHAAGAMHRPYTKYQTRGIFESSPATQQLIQSDTTLVPRTSVQIKYNRYGAGEAELAWLDEAVTLHAHGGLRDAVVRMIEAVRAAVRDQQLPIGHVKFLVQTRGHEVKISLPSLDQPGWEREIPDLKGNSADVLINARVETPADQLRALVRVAVERAAAESGATVSELDVAYLHPNFPRPTHRMN